jgi:hypothetical protein
VTFLHTAGLFIAVARGYVPPSYIDLALQPDAFVHTPTLPHHAIYLQECAYDKYEAVANTQACILLILQHVSSSSCDKYEAVANTQARILLLISHACILLLV